MSFDTASFWLFFCVAWGLWRFLPFGLAKAATLVCSLFFYGWWNPWYLLLLGFSSVADYFIGARIHATAVERTRRRWLILSLVVNLGLLAFFKYTPFVVDNAGRLFGGVSAAMQARMRGWVIPVGISFYTFQTMSYSLDIYRRKLAPARGFLDFFLYVSFFPQLVAGPIVRAAELLPQFDARRRLTPERVQSGLYFVVWGLFMKIVIADNLAAGVDIVFDMDRLRTMSPGSVWLGVTFFSAQIFADFAGYSAVAIGLAHLMGLRFPQNFRYPYISTSFSEFWTRWHITLSRWLRDYLYIPLGGNRQGRTRTYVNLMATMLLGGLWHGASWTFVVWGGIHGVALAVERALGADKRMRLQDCMADGRFLPLQALRLVARMAIVLLVVQVSWVFFRARSFEMAWLVLHKMFVAPLTEPAIAGVIGKRYVLLLVPVALFHGANLLQDWTGARRRPYLNAVAAAVMLFLILIVTRTDSNAFIYFQF